MADVLEEFLGAPLLESKIEGGYDIIAQLLGEMCDAGTVSNTEPNALRDLIDVPGWMGKLLGGVGLSGCVYNHPGQMINAWIASLIAVPRASRSSVNSTSLQNSGFNTQPPLPQLPWRRANVRHTSNELYVDIIESLSVIIAPSGRPLSAFANGSIAFTSKISGIPDILLTLSSTTGKSNLQQILELPVFHPCVRLARWRERPGELSFVPPDGRFVLAGYEVDLLPSASSGKGPSSSAAASVHLPVSVEIRTGLGPVGAEFEARLTLSNNFPGTISAAAAGGFRGSLGSRLGTSSPAFGGSTNQPVIEDVVVTIPVPSSVRNMTDLHASRGEAQYTPIEGMVEWRLPSKETSSFANGATATLRCTVVGQRNDDDDDDGEDIQTHATPYDTTYSYNEAEGEEQEGTYQQQPTTTTASTSNPTTTTTTTTTILKQSTSSSSEKRDQRRIAQNAHLMPTAATISFSVKGWLPSGIKVEGLTLNTKTSRGLGEGVRPYKGVKYLTVSKEGVEFRC